MFRSRTLLVAAGAVTALAVAATPALAVQSQQSMTASVAPAQKSGLAKASVKRPVNVAVNVNPRVAFDPKDSPFSTSKAVISLDKSVTWGGWKLPGCTGPQAVLGTCSPKAKIGSGTALALAAGLKEQLTVTAYNGSDGRSVLLRVQGDKPLPVNEVIVGSLSKATGAYGSKMTLLIPQGLQQPAPGAWATLLDFNVTLKGGNAASPLFGLTNAPKGGAKVRGAFTYTDGTTQTVTTTAALRK